MYCSACGTPLAPGLSYCNRCGTSLKVRAESQTGPVNAYLSAITFIGLGGLGLMLGGAIALKNGAQLKEEIIGIFMLMIFFIIGTVEILLCRQLSRVISAEKKQSAGPSTETTPSELSPVKPRMLHEPMPSVTENTTRTLDYSRNEALK